MTHFPNEETGCRLIMIDVVKNGDILSDELFFLRTGKDSFLGWVNHQK